MEPRTKPSHPSSSWPGNHLPHLVIASALAGILFIVLNLTTYAADPRTNEGAHENITMAVNKILNKLDLHNNSINQKVDAVCGPKNGVWPVPDPLPNACPVGTTSHNALSLDIEMGQMPAAQIIGSFSVTRTSSGSGKLNRVVMKIMGSYDTRGGFGPTDYRLMVRGHGQGTTPPAAVNPNLIQGSCVISGRSGRGSCSAGNGIPANEVLLQGSLVEFNTNGINAFINSEEPLIFDIIANISTIRNQAANAARATSQIKLVSIQGLTNASDSGTSAGGTNPNGGQCGWSQNLDVNSKSLVY